MITQQTSEDLFDAIASDVAEAMDRVGQQIVDEIKNDLSVPVEYKKGPRGGTIIVRSKPGEHPRKETGKLQEGIEHRIERNGADVILTVGDDVFYAVPLENIDRPITEGGEERFEDLVVSAVVAAINGESI